MKTVRTKNLLVAAFSSTPAWLVIGILALAGVSLAGWLHMSPDGSAPDISVTSGKDHCDTDISRAKKNNIERDSSLSGAPPVINSTEAPGPAPVEMVWIPAGEFSMGSEDPGFKDAKPVHRVKLNGFWMDKTEVTNEQFERFAKATGYITVAERKPRAEDFPGAPPENLVAGSVVFSPPTNSVPLNDQMQWWNYVKGADWRHPEGANSSIKGRAKHPVVHVAYEDTLAFAKWAGKRLPTEAEFEWAARGGLDRKKYTWGDEFKPDGKFRANSFQGKFPEKNTAQDGFAATAPVGSFEPNAFGLFDMAGNTWEWCSDWYRDDYYATLAAMGMVENPTGPNDSRDPAEPGIAKRVMKGGSFLCTDEYCSRYMPGGRGKGAPDTGTNHLGFRLVRDAQ